MSESNTPLFHLKPAGSFDLWAGGPWGSLLYHGRPLPPQFPEPAKMVALNDPASPYGSISSATVKVPVREGEEERKPAYFLAITGTAFRSLKAGDNKLDPESTFKKVVLLCSVFARMSPDDKASLVESLIDLGFVTGMCGDGANDCGALKQAHVGVSLSEVEASIAAPFTSKTATIECVHTIILEGRGSLSTSFQEFKATAIFAMIQYMTSMIIIVWQCLLTDFQFLMIDIFATLPILFTIGFTHPTETLAKNSPVGTLISWPVISSLFFHTALTLIFQVFGIVVLYHCDGFVKVDVNSDNDQDFLVAYEVTAVYLISIFHYLFSGFSLSFKDDFLKYFYTNIILLLGLSFVFILSVFILIFSWCDNKAWVDGMRWLPNLMQMKPVTDPKFYIYLIVTSLVYLVLVMLFDHLIGLPNLPKQILRRTNPNRKLRAKVKFVGEKERKNILEKELEERRRSFEKERLAHQERDEDDYVLPDPSDPDVDQADINRVNQPYGSAGEKASREFEISEEEILEIYRSIPAQRTVYRKPYYALLTYLNNTSTALVS